MKLISEREQTEIYGGGALSLIGSALGRGSTVISDALNGNAPAPFPGGDFLTSTAKGPTPGNVGGRYPASEIGSPRSKSNIGGGEIGRAVGSFLLVVPPQSIDE